MKTDKNKKKRQEKWLEKNKDYNKEYYHNNKEKIREQQKDYYLKNKEKICEQTKKYQEETGYKRKYYLKNREKSIKYAVNRNRERKLTDPIYKFKHYVRGLIYTAFKRTGFEKNSNTEDILGCSFEEFHNHIINQFEDWMTLENHGKYNGEYKFGWDIDHIIESHTAKTKEDVIKLNRYTNLRPLDSKINRSDRNKKQKRN
jgi:hypothetical protein